MATRDREISFNIRHRIGIINTYQSGWKKEVNLVEWNEGPAKVDIRDWDPSHTHMGKGITLYPEEAEKLQWMLYRYFRGKGASMLKGREDANLVPVPQEEAVPFEESQAFVPPADFEETSLLTEPRVSEESQAFEAAALEKVLPEIDAETGEILVELPVQSVPAEPVPEAEVNTYF